MDTTFIQFGDGPESFLIDERPGLALVHIDVGPEEWWVFLAVGTPSFSEQEERDSQRFMRRYGLDQTNYSTLDDAVKAVQSAVDLESRRGSAD